MTPFAYVRANDIDTALAAAAGDPGAKFIAGGTNLLDLMKGYVERPARLIDITPLPLSDITELGESGVRIGALARNSDVADHPLIRARYPLVARALLAGATPQLRNAATVGGNLLQRTRCHYFYDSAFPMCNKRKPQSGCGAIDGENRMHAILGASEHCIATHPSDLCVALAALDARVQMRSRRDERTIPLNRFYRLPGAEPGRETELAPGELITAVDLPPAGFAEHSQYVKVRDRASFAFAVVSVAAALELREGVIHDARIALGGVAHKPWRAYEAEKLLRGRTPESNTLTKAAAAAVADARPQKHNAFKVELVKRAIVRALQLSMRGFLFLPPIHADERR